MTVVLVPGAWHGSWCFEPVVAGLAAQGVDALAADLAGDDLHADAGAVRSLLDQLDGDVVLAGHSYGGAVITEAGVHPRVRHLVYLCAFVLDEGESCMTAAAGDPATAAISHDGRPNLGDAFRTDDAGLVTLDPAGARACFYNACEPATASWAVGQLRPHALASLGQPPAEIAWRQRPSTYVVCRDDMAVHPDLQRVLATRCDEVVELAADHSPFLSTPDDVVALLARLSRDIS